MSGIFRPGQLVVVDEAMLAKGERLSLFNVPGGIDRIHGESVRAISWITSGQVALLVSRERTTNGEVYLLGPNGGGWAPAAFLRLLWDVPR